MSEGLSRVGAILTNRLGLNSSAIGAGRAPRAAEARMKALGMDDLEAYSELAAGSEVEIQALIDEMVIPESWFFRDGHPFRFLTNFARSEWVARPSRPPLRVLSIPCAAGEEPYSIAIALEEAGLASHRRVIDAVDISFPLLERARRGLYSSNALRASSPEFIGRWFQKVPEGFKIIEPIHRSVRFHWGNLLDPRLLIGEPRYDVIFCRNVLIYFNSPSRAAALANLERLLVDDGILIVGHADGLDGSRFVLAAEPGAFAHRRRKLGEAPGRRPPPSPPLSPRRLFADFKAAFPPVEPSVRPEPQPSPAPVAEEASAAPLDQARDRADLGEHDEALALCERDIARRGPSAAALHLMGVIHQAAGRRAEAERCFHKAVYLDPKHDEALLALALLAEGRGDRAGALGFRRRAERALRSKETSRG